MAETLTAFNLVHRLWTKAVGTPAYKKAEWRAMERMILALEEREKLLADIEARLTNPPGRQNALSDEIIERIENRRSIDPNVDGDLPDHAASFQEPVPEPEPVREPFRIYETIGIGVYCSRGEKLEITR